MAWRGDDLEAEAKVNVHVLVDCLSSTVRGAQTHAGPGCSVVILLASAPRALALGPSVHPPHPRRRRRAALALVISDIEVMNIVILKILWVT